MWFNNQSAKKVASPLPPEKQAVAVIAMSAEKVTSIIEKYGFETFRSYLQKTFSLYLRDTGGQVEFQEMLPLLISGPSIFFFVFRVDLDFQSKFTVEYRTGESKPINSFGTHIDQLGPSADAKIFELDQQIDTLIKKNGFQDIVQYVDKNQNRVIFPVERAMKPLKRFDQMSTALFMAEMSLLLNIPSVICCFASTCKVKREISLLWVTSEH